MNLLSTLKPLAEHGRCSYRTIQAGNGEDELWTLHAGINSRPIGHFTATKSTRASFSGLISTLILSVVALSCSVNPPDDAAYLAKILVHRENKDLIFLKEQSSPVPIERRSTMLPLSYFPPGLDYRVPAQLLVAEEKPVFKIPTSSGKVRSMQRVGVLEFTLKGQSLTLSALIETENRSLDRLFVPFADMTTGLETYQAGRYLDLDRTVTGIYDLDFNYAYQPYCYYDEQYDCPFPPPENRIPVAVHAGERLPLSGS